MDHTFILFDLDNLGRLDESTQTQLAQLVASRPAGTTGILTNLTLSQVTTLYGFAFSTGRMRLYSADLVGLKEKNNECHRLVLNSLRAHGFYPNECQLVSTTQELFEVIRQSLNLPQLVAA